VWFHDDGNGAKDGEVTVSRDLLIGVALGVVLTLVLLAVAIGLGSRWIKKRMSSGLQPAPARSLKGWDYRMRLRTMDDQIIDASTFRDRALFLNFWATWCAPCVAELPSIERLVKRLDGASVAFACVTSEPLDKVKAFAANKGLKVPLYVLVDEPPVIFETRSIPATFIVRDGDIISQHIGAARWDTDEIVAMLAGSPTLPTAKVRATWENRLPAIEPPWTHWRLLGQGTTDTFIADVPADDVAGAIRLVTSNHRSFRRISAELVRFTSDGSCVLSKRRNVIHSADDL
jgi:thiol-disulfide isomerase/thioredoxin